MLHRTHRGDGRHRQSSQATRRCPLGVSFTAFSQLGGGGTFSNEETRFNINISTRTCLLHDSHALRLWKHCRELHNCAVTVTTCVSKQLQKSGQSVRRLNAASENNARQASKAMQKQHKHKWLQKWCNQSIHRGYLAIGEVIVNGFANQSKAVCARTSRRRANKRSRQNFTISCTQ